MGGKGDSAKHLQYMVALLTLPVDSSSDESPRSVSSLKNNLHFHSLLLMSRLYSCLLSLLLTFKSLSRVVLDIIIFSHGGILSQLHLLLTESCGPQV